MFFIIFYFKLWQTRSIYRYFFLFYHLFSITQFNLANIFICVLKSLSEYIYLNSFSMFFWQLLIPERARQYMDDIKAARNYGRGGDGRS